MTKTDTTDVRTRCRRHAMRRGWQRLGLAIGEPELRAIEAKIANGGASYVRDCGGRRHLWRVPFRDRRLLVLHDKALKTVVTFLPESAAVPRRSRDQR